MRNQLLDHGRSAFCVVSEDETLQRVIAAVIELELGARSVVGPTIETVESLLGEALPKLFIACGTAGSSTEPARTIEAIRARHAGTPLIAITHPEQPASIAGVPVLPAYPLDAARLLAEIRTQLRLPPATRDGAMPPKDGG